MTRGQLLQLLRKHPNYSYALYFNGCIYQEDNYSNLDPNEVISHEIYALLKNKNRILCFARNAGMWEPYNGPLLSWIKIKLSGHIYGYGMDSYGGMQSKGRTIFTRSFDSCDPDEAVLDQLQTLLLLTE